MAKVELTFFGGVGKVTGANFLLSIGDKKYLVDCGLIQGSKLCEDENYKPFSYDPSSVDALLVTHAHLDHIGRIPKLVKEGFKGEIYSTPETKALAEIMFEDAISIFRSEENKNKEPLYGTKDAENALSLWRGIPYHEETKIGETLFSFKDAGHILGSSMIEVAVGRKKIVFTGDLGNSPSTLLPDTEEIKDANFMVMESVYGDRVHEKRGERDRRFKEVLLRTINRGGTVVIPSFSIERTQNILYVLNNFIENGEVPSVPVFLDSPLAIRVTDIYKRSADLFNESIKNEIKNGDDIFNFPKLSFTITREDSNAIERTKGAKIILAGSGMSMGGRVTKHELDYLPESKNSLILVGYQAVGTLGRVLQDRVSKISINGEKIPVKAEIISVSGFSSHRDSEGLFSFVESTAKSLNKVFVAMGEPKASLFLVQRLRDYLGVDAVYPKEEEPYTLFSE